MARFYIYDSVSNSNTTLKANGKLKDIFPELDFKHSIVLKAGNRLDGDYCCTEDDVLYIRKVPGVVSTAAAIAIAITVAVVAVGVGVGAAIYAKQKSEEAKREMEKAQRNAKNMAQQAQQLPFIRGAKNKKALGEAIQFVMGSVYNTPYNVTDGYYSIDGADGVNSYYNAVFSAGYGSQKITQLLLGNENIKKDNNGISGVNNFDSTSLYYDPSNSNIVEVRQPGEALTITDGNQKVSATYAGAELKHEYGQDAEPVIVQAAENAMKIQVCIAFSCLRQYDSDAETWQERTAIVRPYWSNDGGATWHEFFFSGTTNNTFVKNSNKTIRYVATKNFSGAESYGKNISIKVVKETPKAESGSQEDCQLLWYQTYCYDASLSNSTDLVACTPLAAEAFNKVTRVAYRIIASDTTQNLIDELHAMSEGYAYTWNGSAWSTTKSPTRNPASWLVEVLTSDIHLPSKFNSNELYLPSFGVLYEYCEENGFYCDGILTQSEKKLDIVEKILSLCNASLIINQDGLLEVVIDKEEQNPVALLNAENIVSFSFSKSLQKQTDGTKVTFTNRDSWSIDTFYSMLDGGSYDYTTDTVETLALDYVTTYPHAYKLAQRKQRQRQLQPREIKADVGSEGDWYPLYSTVLVQIPQLLQGLNSSVIKQIITNSNGKITNLVISDLVEFVSGSRYGVVIQATNAFGFKLYSGEVTGTGKTRTLTFSTPLSLSSNVIVPEIGNHLSFGLLDDNGHFTKVTHTMKIYGNEPNGKEGYTLTLRDYDEEVYSYGGSIPTYKSNITRPQAGNTPVSIDDINKLRQDMNVLQEDLINAYQLLEMPVVVDADVKNVIIETLNGKTVGVQGFETTVFVRQGAEDLSFQIGHISLPLGWQYEVIGNKVKFTIPEDYPLSFGSFYIPVTYVPNISYEQYEDEDEDTYVDENGKNYMCVTSASQSYTYNIWISYMNDTAERYLGPITQVSQLPQVKHLNDFFVWAGSDTSSTLSITGTFKKGTLYKYIGSNFAWEWDIDTDKLHNSIALSDVLGIADADLRNNNSTVYEYLDHLTSNSIYTDMLVANSAFIRQLTTEVVNVGQLINVGDAESYADAAAAQAELDAIFAAATDATQKANAAQSAAEAAAAADATMKATQAEAASEIRRQELITALSADPREGHTVIDGGFIKTSLIEADAIWAEILSATSATFENITVTGASIFNGTVNATSGVFTGQQTINGVFKLNGILQTAFPILKASFSDIYDVSKDYFEEKMVAWIRDIVSRELYLSSTTGNFYLKASGYVATQFGAGIVLCVRLVMEMGTIADDKYIIYIWDESNDRMLEAVRKTWDVARRYEIYSVDPNSLGTWDTNVNPSFQGNSYLTGCVSFS